MATATVQVASVSAGLAYTQISGDYSNYVMLDSGTANISSGGSFSENEDWDTAPDTGEVSFNTAPQSDNPILAVRPRTDHTNGFSAASVPPFKKFKSGNTGWEYYRTFMTKSYGHKFDWRLYVPMSDSALDPNGDYGLRVMDEGGSIVFDSRFLEDNTVMNVVDTIKTPGWYYDEGDDKWRLKFFYGEQHVSVGTTSNSAFYGYSSLINGDVGWFLGSNGPYANYGQIHFQTTLMDVKALAWDDHGDPDAMTGLVAPSNIINAGGNIHVNRTQYVGITHSNYMKYNGDGSGANNWPTSATNDGIGIYKQTIPVIKP